MKKRKKNVCCRIMAWFLAACLLSGMVSAGAEEEAPQEDSGVEAVCEPVTEGYAFSWDESAMEPEILEESGEDAIDGGQEEETETEDFESQEEPDDAETETENPEEESETDQEVGVLDVENMGSLTAEDLTLLVGPDDPAAEETMLLAVREAQAAAAEASAYASPDLSGKFSEIFSRAGSYLCSTVTDPVINSIGGEWAVLGLARAGYPAGAAYYTKYAKNVSDEVTRAGGVLSDVKYTEYSRVALALTAAGYDAGDVAGYDLIAPLSDLENVAWQGINGPIWALIALDSHGYELRPAPSGKTQATRQNLIGAILEGQLDDGGWSIAGFSADPDMTAMALMALTPYYNDGGTWSVYGESVTVRQAVDRGLETLSAMQDGSGGYISYSEPNSESCAQVLIALAGLGIDPEKDAHFQKNGRSVLDALLSYADASGGFSHTAGTGVNGMSCEQAYCALAAYSRYLNGQNRLYDMADVGSLQAVPKPEDFAVDPEPETEDNSDGNNSPGENNEPNGNDAPNETNKPGGDDEPGGTNKPDGDNSPNGNNKPDGDSSSNGNNKPGGNNDSDENSKPGGDKETEPESETNGTVNENGNNGTGGTSRPGGSTHSLGNTTGGGSSSRGSSSGGSSSGKTLEEGMAEVTLDGKRYVVDEKAADLIGRIQELSEGTESAKSGTDDGDSGVLEESAMEDLLQIYREYLELSEEQQAYVLNYDVLEGLMGQAGKQNHMDADTKICAEGVEWYIRLDISPVEETDVFYQELQNSIGSGTLQTLYRIGFTDLLTGEEYRPDREIALVIPEDLTKPEAESFQPDKESEDSQFLIVLVSEEGSIWYPDFVRENGTFMLKAEGFAHFGIAAARAESSLVLEDETEPEESEVWTEVLAGPEEETESESESEPALAAAGFGGPMTILWIIMLVVGTNILVLSFLGKKGYLNFHKDE